ncbi:hypothetical protein CRG98_017552 [Punica granatum]|uniref:Uncharacterized protein n=1 Tax=Punica granatum TaxID=22663 RepID=A0A2I0K0U2_PUNGR|nr:hypothetical protein CRG98_017552 [Punica granatum]
MSECGHIVQRERCEELLVISDQRLSSSVGSSEKSGSWQAGQRVMGRSAVVLGMGGAPKFYACGQLLPPPPSLNTPRPVRTGGGDFDMESQKAEIRQLVGREG